MTCLTAISLLLIAVNSIVRQPVHPPYHQKCELIYKKATELKNLVLAI
ncbi:hypothetical protein QUB30_29640 [Microcoleus sp. BROC3]